MAPGHGGAPRKPGGGGYGETGGRGEGGNHAPSRSGSSYTQGGGAPPEAVYTREHIMLMTYVPAVADTATTGPTIAGNSREEGEEGGEGEIGEEGLFDDWGVPMKKKCSKCRKCKCRKKHDKDDN